MPIIPNQNIIFIHVPKTGGSSVNEYFNLARIREQNSVLGNFICEQKLPGTIQGEYGKPFITTSQDLRPYISKGDFIRVGGLLYQVHSKKPLRPHRIHLASIDSAGKIMKGCIAEQEGVYIGPRSKNSVHKRLVSDPKGDRIIPSKFHWGWLNTSHRDGHPLVQVFDNSRIRQSGNPALELDHVSIQYIKSRLPEQVFDRMYKFAFVRNPYARLVSEYFWKRKDADTRLGIDCRTMSFTQFIHTLQRKWKTLLAQPHWEVSHYMPQYLFVCDDDDNIIVDYIAKYEDGLEQGIDEVFRQLGTPPETPIKLPKSNVTKTSRDHYSSYYTTATRDIVADLYRKDFEIFDYSLDPVPEYGDAPPLLNSAVGGCPP